MDLAGAQHELYVSLENPSNGQGSIANKLLQKEFPDGWKLISHYFKD